MSCGVLFDAGEVGPNRLVANHTRRDMVGGHGVLIRNEILLGLLSRAAASDDEYGKQRLDVS